MKKHNWGIKAFVSAMAIALMVGSVPMGQQTYAATKKTKTTKTTTISNVTSTNDTRELADTTNLKVKLSGTEIYAKASKAMVEIRCKDADKTPYVGSGFFVSKNMVLTSAHVIGSAQKIVIVDYNGEEYGVKEIAAYDEKDNLALIKVRRDNDNYLGFASSVKVGEPIWAIGSPVGLTGSFINGMVSRQTVQLDGKDYVQLCMPTGTGLGGGPIINEYGEVIGTLNLTVPSAQNICMSTTTKTCTNFVNSASSSTKITLGDFYAKTKESRYTTNVYEISDSYKIMTQDEELEAASAAKRQLSASEIYDASWDAMVDILTILNPIPGYESYAGGSGFFISDDMIVTNKHVVEQAAQIHITDYKGNEYVVHSVKKDYKNNTDLVIITVAPKNINTTHGVLKINPDYIPVVGEELYGLGSPAGFENTFSNGVVSMSSREVWDFNYIQMTVPIIGGSSGGPVFNKFGEVVGVTTITVNLVQNCNLALQIKYLENVQL